jgi:hypothetical protein
VIFYLYSYMMLSTMIWFGMGGWVVEIQRYHPGHSNWVAYFVGKVLFWFFMVPMVVWFWYPLNLVFRLLQRTNDGL